MAESVSPEAPIALAAAAALVCVLLGAAARSAARAWRRSGVAHRSRATSVGRPAVVPAIDHVGAAVAATAPLRAIRRQLAVRTYDVDLAEALDGVARQLRTGVVLSAALAAVAVTTGGAVGRDLRTIVARAQLVGLEAALESWSQERRAPAAELAAAVLTVGSRTGGAAGPAIDQAAVGIRQRAAAVAEARSLTAQARLSAAVLSVAPIVFAAVVSAIDPSVGSFLVATPAGAFLVATGLSLDAVGWFWMRRLVAAVAW